MKMKLSRDNRSNWIKPFRRVAKNVSVLAWLASTRPSRKTLVKPTANKGKRCHVCFVIDSAGRSGAEKQLETLLLGLDTNRFQLHVALPFDAEVFDRQAFRDRGGIIHSVPFWEVGDPFRQHRILTRFFRERKFDVVCPFLFYSNLVCLPAAAAAGIPHRVAAIRNMVSISDPSQSAWWHKAGIRRALSHAHIVTGNSRAVTDDLLSYAEVSENKLQVVYNAHPPRPLPSKTMREQCRASLGISGDDLAICTVGRLTPQKHVDRVLSAIARIADRLPQARLHLFGEGPDRRSLADLTKQLGLEHIVRFHGNVPEVDRLLPAFDLLLMASSFEGLPNALVEAQYAGLVVVATDAGGCAEAIQNKETGEIVSIGDVGGMAQAAIRLLEDQALREEMGIRAHHFASQRFSEGGMIETFSRLLTPAHELTSG